MQPSLLPIALVLACLSCDARFAADVPKSSYRVAVDAESDPGKALAGVQLRLANHTIGTTDESGRALLALSGVEGDAVALGILCPSQYQSPSQPLVISLHRFVDRTIVPAYPVSCTPSSRVVVVAIRADNGPNLPVVHLGREVAHTDGAGIAHVLIEAKAGESEEFTLVTEGPSSAYLRPVNPALAFVAKPRDDFVLLDQKFVEERPKVRAPPPPRIHRPTQL